MWLMIKISMIIISLFIIRRTRIFFVVFFCFIFSFGLTVIQIITDNNTLALLFPWRISVFLVPLSFFIIVAAITSWIVVHFPFKGKYIKKIVIPICLILILFVGAKGIEITKQKFHTILSFKSIQIMKWVKDHQHEKDIYLVPPRNIHKFGKFRLFTGVPIFVDALTHPYKDKEVIEWYKRIRLAKRFYRRKFINYNLLLNILAKEYNITHIILIRNEKVNIDTSILLEKYKTSHYSIYKIINQ